MSSVQHSTRSIGDERATSAVPALHLRQTMIVILDGESTNGVNYIKPLATSVFTSLFQYEQCKGKETVLGLQHAWNSLILTLMDLTV